VLLRSFEKFEKFPIDLFAVNAVLFIWWSRLELWGSYFAYYPIVQLIKSSLLTFQVATTLLYLLKFCCIGFKSISQFALLGED